MNYQYIVNPSTGRRVSIHTKLGQQIVYNYAMIGGGKWGDRFSAMGSKISSGAKAVGSAAASGARATAAAADDRQG